MNPDQVAWQCRQLKASIARLWQTSNWQRLAAQLRSLYRHRTAQPETDRLKCESKGWDHQDFGAWRMAFFDEDETA